MNVCVCAWYAHLFNKAHAQNNTVSSTALFCLCHQDGQHQAETGCADGGSQGIQGHSGQVGRLRARSERLTCCCCDFIFYYSSAASFCDIYIIHKSHSYYCTEMQSDHTVTLMYKEKYLRN